MREPVLLSIDEVVEIHNDQIKRYGGHAGIRDIELLKSAIAMPAVGGDNLHTDIYEMAAVYLWHIARKHPFKDGNRRTGAAASIVFLLLNEIEINANWESFKRMVISAAEMRMDKAAIARFFRSNSRSPE